MSRYPIDPLDFTALKTIPIAQRGGKVRVEHCAAAPEKAQRLGAWLVFALVRAVSGAWLEGLPKLLAADSLRAVVAALRTARERQRGICWGIGGHVVKCGLAPVFVDWMERGYITGLAMNGAASIHDFELAIAGATSEDVEAVLPDGRFGSAEETGHEMNVAIRMAQERGIGMGEALGERLDTLADPQFADKSLLLQAWRRRIPVTVHVATGTDTPHTHPAASGAAIGAATHHDLPEVFLKAVSAARNLGHPLRNFTTVNLDFMQHYRPRMNVIERPHAQSGGQGYSLTGHHEIMLPLLAGILADLDG